MRRFYQNPRVKEHSTSFYLSDELLNKLSFIAQYEGVSRSVIVERALIFIRKGRSNEAWEYSKRAYKRGQNKKKISTQQNRKCANRKATKKNTI